MPTRVGETTTARIASTSAAATASTAAAAGPAASTSDHVAEASREEKLLHKCE